MNNNPLLKDLFDELEENAQKAEISTKEDDSEVFIDYTSRMASLLKQLDKYNAKMRNQKTDKK